MEVSVLVCVWHHHLGRGDVGTVLNVANKVRDVFLSKFNFYVMHGYNMCKSMLFCGLVYCIAGSRDRALECMNLTMECFVKAVACRTKNLSWFRELKSSHQCAAAALGMIKLLEAGSPISDGAVARELAATFRVKDEAFVARATAALLACRNQASLAAAGG